MKEFTLTVAGYRIRFVSASGGPDLVPAERFLRNISEKGDCDICITVHDGSPAPPSDLKRVFHAPLVEEVEGKPVRRLENFWSVYSHGSGLMLKTVFPRLEEHDNEISGLLSYSLDSKEWDLYVGNGPTKFDPFEYPLDGLILYYLTVMHGDIFIHGSAVEYKGRGYLFTGVSGAGKTTMASLWEKEGATVIHDDRLIIRKIDDKFVMYNTPVYNNEEPRSTPLSGIFLIEHGAMNELLPVKGAMALSRIMSNCIQHNWSTDLIGKLTGSLYELTHKVPVAAYWFVPDSSAVKYILSHE
jgi:hypothetical protein